MIKIITEYMFELVKFYFEDFDNLKVSNLKDYLMLAF